MRSVSSPGFRTRLAGILNTITVLLLLLSFAAPLTNSNLLDSYPLHGHLYFDPANPGHSHGPANSAARRAPASGGSRGERVVSFVAPSGLSDGASASTPIAVWSDLGIKIQPMLQLLDTPQSFPLLSASIAPPEHPPQSS